MATRLLNDVTAETAESTRRKIARRLLPFLFVLYIANYLDRANLAYAALGMTRTLGFSDAVFGTAAGIFFVSYVALQMPGALLVERWSARKLVAATMIGWGLLTMLTAWVHTPAQLYAARFLLGGAESGFFPGVIVYLSHWFLYKDRAKANGSFMVAIPVSFMIGSPIAGMLLGVHWLHIDGWRWLFMLEGLPAVLLGTAGLAYLTDRPPDAQWLSIAERDWITDSLAKERNAKSGVHSFTIARALRYPPIVILSITILFSYTAFYSFIFWFPTILKRMSGLSDMRVGFLGAIPYVAGFIGMKLLSWNSDRMRERRWHFAATQFIASAALLAIATLSPSVTTSIILFAVVGFSICAELPCFWALPGAFLSDSASAASIGFINGFGSIGGFVGPYMMGFLLGRTKSFVAGIIYMIGSLVIAGVLVLFCPRERKGVLLPANSG